MVLLCWTMTELLLKKTLSRFRTKTSSGENTPVIQPSALPTAPPTAPPPLCSRSYLQSLERSSRAWVLSSGVSPPLHLAAPHDVQVGVQGEGCIWYNPIPEEEEPTKRRAELCCKETDQSQRRTVSAELPGVSGGVSERVIDRLRSPALKLRRKLSFKSRRDRHGTSSQDTPPANQDTPLVNHNTPPAERDTSQKGSSSPSRKRAIRRQLSGCKGRHGDDEAPPLTLGQGEEPCFHSPAHCLSGVLTVHLQGLEQLPHRVGVSRRVSVVLKIDDVVRARTAAMTMTGPALHLDHAFHLPLDQAETLKVLVLTRVSPDPGAQTCSKTKLWTMGGVCLSSLFADAAPSVTGSQSQDMILDMDPRGHLLLKLSLQAGEEAGGRAQVFGAELSALVQRESSEKPVPLILQKTIAEINRRGLKVEGIYRLCGSSSVKRLLRDEFEMRSISVDLRTISDLHAISGVLKDYLRELPSPLITPSLYNAVQEAMSSAPHSAPDPLQLLHCLPLVYRETLSSLMSHLSLVASFSALNKMDAQNLAVCFGPVLFAAVQTDQWEGGAEGGGTGPKAHQPMSNVDFKQHIESLHFLLQHWPLPETSETNMGRAMGGATEEVGGARCRWRDRCQRQRRAGDWSLFQNRTTVSDSVDEEPMMDFEAPFNCRLSLKDFDKLIQDFHLQLSRV